MTRRQQVIGAAALAVGALVAYWQGGTVPNSPTTEIDRACGRIALQLSCDDIKTVKPSHPCVGGDVLAWFEVVGDKNTALDEDGWMQLVKQHYDRAKPLPHTYERFSCAEAKRPTKQLTPLDWADVPTEGKCIAGLVSKNTGSRWRTWAEPHVCCGDVPSVCRCNDLPCATVMPHQFSGGGDWLARFCEGQPDSEFCP